MDLGITGRRAVVTGASRGIGAAVTRLLRAEGVEVVEVSRTAGIDVTAHDAAERIGEPPDILVNNAGTTRIRDLADLTDGEWQEQWEINVMAPMRLMRAFAPVMADRGWGRIVNVASSSGKRPSGTNAAYSVGKAAMLSLSRAFADAYAARGVLVNAVAPGVVEGSMWRSEGGLAEQMAEATGVTPQEALDSVFSKPPVGRAGTEEEIAAVIAFLCSQRASYVAGAAWSVDGGSVPVVI
jgi:3-oxoacyl-[acyl-carrier protein] reductase